ncbi:MAG TPA: 23S rRNA (adenine(2503)-C(2))-methyltransferase RlmN [Kiritimatiellia bacterium]|nr:23S rRNA (adenine(2503)-C(2))-methyltransferase RlmN [Kiritimatiellia bacterium]
MISVYDIDGLARWASAHGVDEPTLKRFRVAFFKKALAEDDCLAMLPPSVRAAFQAAVALPSLDLVARQDSNRDGATKLSLRTADGHRVEAVILRVASGRTSLCISSQVGCAANCQFCATAKLGLARNLTTDEILAQVSLAQRLLRAEARTLRNIVFMGMGEPLHNEKNLYAALDTLRNPRAFYFADRHLMVSTVGMVAAMGRFRERFPTVNLALSLHSARQEVRRDLMPAAKSQTLEKLRAVFPPQGSPSPLMIEYVLLQGVNDGPDDLTALIDYLRGAEVHINLIPFNPHPGAAFTPVGKAEREAFAHALRRAGYKVTLRRSLGDDIAAACGQLAGVHARSGN